MRRRLSLSALTCCAIGISTFSLAGPPTDPGSRGLSARPPQAGPIRQPTLDLRPAAPERPTPQLDRVIGPQLDRRPTDVGRPEHAPGPAAAGAEGVRPAASLSGIGRRPTDRIDRARQMRIDRLQALQFPGRDNRPMRGNQASTGTSEDAPRPNMSDPTLRRDMLLNRRVVRAERLYNLRKAALEHLAEVATRNGNTRLLNETILRLDTLAQEQRARRLGLVPEPPVSDPTIPDVTPDPSPIPEPTPDPTPDPQPTPEPEPTPEPQPTPDPQPTPEPEPTPEPQPVP